MKTDMFCAHHAAKMRANEGEALRHWTQMMHRGVRAYAECRMDAARIYLESALEIGLLRCNQANNQIFSTTHIFKPAEFAVKMYCMMDIFDRAQRVVERIVEAYNKRTDFFDEGSDAFLSKQYEFIEKAEKSFFGFTGEQRLTAGVGNMSSQKH